MYQFIAIDPSNFTATAKILSLLSTVIQIFIIFTWILSIKKNADLKKEKLIIGKDESFVHDYGQKAFIFAVILLFIHPLYPSIDVKFFIPESYYTPDTTFEDYKRPIVEYCIMI